MTNWKSWAYTSLSEEPYRCVLEASLGTPSDPVEILPEANGHPNNLDPVVISASAGIEPKGLR
jgi:hypothetical protein